MVRFVGIVLLLCVAHAVALVPKLPHMDVGEYNEDDISELVSGLPSPEAGGWWVRIGSRLFSPSLDQEDEDVDISAFRIVLGPRQELPNSVKQLIVASDDKHGAHIIHTSEKIAIPPSLNAKPLKSGMELFIDARKRAEEADTVDLERNLEEEELTAAMAHLTSETYEQELTELTGLGSGPKHQRNVDASEGHFIAEEYLSCRMLESGLEVQLVPFQAAGQTLMNVVGCKPGTSSKKFLMVGAHYDTLPHPPSKSPGAMDNGSGVAVDLSVLTSISGFNFQNSVCIAGFDGEELGCLGSAEIAKQISGDDQLKHNFMGAITADMATGFKPKYNTGRDPGWNSHNSKMLRKDPNDDSADGIHIDGAPVSKELVELYGRVATKVVSDKKMPIMESQAALWHSDHQSFIRHDLPAIDVCAANHRSYEFWHNLRNETENLDFSIGREIARSTVAVLFEMAKFEGKHGPEPVSSSTIPKFHNAKTPQQAFKNLDCASVLQRRPKSTATTEGSKEVSHETASKVVESDESTQKHSNTRVKVNSHKGRTHMRLEVLDELDAAIDEAEALLKKN